MIGGAGSAATYVTAAYTGGSAPAVKFIDVRVLGRTGTGYTSDVLAGHRLGDRQPHEIRHSRHQSVARPPGRRVRRHRPALPRGRARGEGRHRRRHLRRQLWRDVNRRPGSRRDYLPRKFACRDHRGRRSTPRARPIASDDVVAPYSSRGPTRFDLTVKPDVVAPGHPHRLARGRRLVPRARPIRSGTSRARGSNGYLRLSGTSMATGVVSGGVALLLNARAVADAGAGEGGAADRRAVHPVGRPDRRRHRQRRLRAEPEDRRPGPDHRRCCRRCRTLLGLSSGASFFDRGTLIDRVYDRTGIRLLGLLDLDVLLGGADGAESGVLSLLGQTNPLGQTPRRTTWSGATSPAGRRATTWSGAPPIQRSVGPVPGLGHGELDDDYLVWGTQRRSGGQRQSLMAQRLQAPPSAGAARLRQRGSCAGVALFGYCVARVAGAAVPRRMVAVRRADVHQRPDHAEGSRRRSDVHGF